MNSEINASGYIFNLKKYAIHDGPGIRTTVFFQGCPLACWWCHNPESRELSEIHLKQRFYRNCLRPFSGTIPHAIAREVTLNELMPEIEKDTIFYEESGGGVTFSGGEPLMQPEFLLALLKSCKTKAIHTVVDTSGYAEWEKFESILDLVDLFLFDLKFIEAKIHEKYTAVSNQLILRNLQRLSRRKTDTVIRIPLIPGITDTKENLREIANFIRNLDGISKVDLLPYNPIGERKYQQLNQPQQSGKLKTQKPSDLRQMRDIFEDHGFAVKIGG